MLRWLIWRLFFRPLNSTERGWICRVGEIPYIGEQESPYRKLRWSVDRLIRTGLFSMTKPVSKTATVGKETRR